MLIYDTITITEIINFLNNFLRNYTPLKFFLPSAY